MVAQHHVDTLVGHGFEALVPDGDASLAVGAAAEATADGAAANTNAVAAAALKLRSDILVLFSPGLFAFP